MTEFCLVVLAGFGIEALMSLLSRVSSLKSYALPIVGAIVFVGVCDLARIDRLYCAPVDLREAKRQNAGMQMTFLRRADFNNPQVAAMVQQKKIVALAQPNPEMYLVGVLQPRGPYKEKPWPPMGLPTWLGFLSLAMALTSIYALSGFTSWRIANYSLCGIIYAAVLFWNGFFWTPDMTFFRNMNFMHAGPFNYFKQWTSSPFMISINLLLTLILTTIGIVSVIIKKKRGR